MSPRTFPAAVLAADDPIAGSVARVVPPGAKMLTLGNAVLGYEVEAPYAASGGEGRAGSSWTRIAALGTRKRLRALRRIRLEVDGTVGNVAGWAEAVALIATSIDGGISPASLAKHLRYVGVDADDQILYPVARKVAAAHAAGALDVNPRILGELLQLTIVERDQLKIRSIDSCEETASERKARLKRDREAARRRERGAAPRSTSASATQPWIEAGYQTRRTWERNGKVPRMSQVRGSPIDRSYGRKGSATNLQQTNVERHEFATSDGGEK
jgi:hypothetical protein